MLLFILLMQFNYFLSNTSKMIIHNMTIWNIISPSIFQVFLEVNKNVNCYMFDQIIYFHAITP